MLVLVGPADTLGVVEGRFDTVGVTEGNCDGSIDGVPVSTLVGVEDGVMEEDGMKVGTTLGENDGTTLGENDDGITLGENDGGITLGEYDGTSLGKYDGIADGFCEGSPSIRPAAEAASRIINPPILSPASSSTGVVLPKRVGHFPSAV